MDKLFFTAWYKLILTVVLAGIILPANSQIVLEADGPGNTYELINSVLAPGYNAVENPECAHPEFGRHITEVWDSVIRQYVFEFHIHVTPDNDRCINFDRQRVEIKTYDPSPANLKGVTGETIVYKWKFRLPAGFKPSSNFTHLHQIKAVGGNDDDPVFTLTARKGSPNRMELIHDNASKVATANLSLFEGSWVEATERLKVDSVNGTYSLVIKNISTGATVLSYSNNKLMTIRADNSFIRPKWGIYRSLINSQDLRDEVVRFAGFSIQEETLSAVDQWVEEKPEFMIYPNPSDGHTGIKYSMTGHGNIQLDICALNGQVLKSIINDEPREKGTYRQSLELSFLTDGIFLARLSCRNYCRTVKIIVVKQ
jgi:hypothetical protein